jgi:hypothetical protein
MYSETNERINRFESNITSLVNFDDRVVDKRAH